MNPRDSIQKQLDKKRAERAEYQRLVTLADGHIEGLEAALKALPKDAAANGDVALREGGGAAKARDFLLTLGRSAHIAEIVTGIGKEPTHKNKVSLASVMASYARQGKVFTKVPGKPNTFGLIGVEEQQQQHPTVRMMSLTEPFVPEEEDEEDEIEFGDPEQEQEDDEEIVT